MTSNEERHTPTPEFRARLEAEISRALRREQHLSATRWPRWPSVRTMARLAAAVLIGVVVGAAPAQVADARQRDSLLVVARAEMTLAEMRLAIAREEYERLSQRYAVGTVSQRELVGAEGELRALELKLETVQLNIMETQATASPPRDDLAAPLVGQRDYARDRILLELRAAQRELTAAERTAGETERRVRIGAEVAAAQFAAEEARARAEGRLVLLTGKLKLREEFVAGRSTAEAVQHEFNALELRQRLADTRNRLAIAERRHTLVSTQAASGTVTRREALRAELEVAELKMALETLEFQMRRLQAGGR